MEMSVIPIEHPGMILKEEFLVPYGISMEDICQKTGISLIKLRKITEEQMPLSFDIALKMAKFFGLSERYFINLQTEYDLRCMKEKIKDELNRIVPVRKTMHSVVEIPA